MKSLMAILALTFMAAASAIGQWVSLTGPEGKPVAVTLREDTPSGTVIEFTVGGYYLNSVNIEGKPHSVLSIPKAVTFLEKGYPELPRISRSIMIPDEAKMNFEIVEAEYETTRVAPVAPSKGSLSRSIDPKTVPYTFSDVYKTDTWWPQAVVELSNPFILRDVRGITVRFNLFRHNAVRKQLITCKRLVVRVFADGFDDVNVKTSRKGIISHDLLEIYGRFFLNFSQSHAGELGRVSYPAIGDTGRMLIIAADNFYSSMIPLRDWRTRKGHRTTLVKCSDVGTTWQAVLSYIQNMYNSAGSVLYILLVGEEDYDVPNKSVPSDEYPDPYYYAPWDPKYVKLAGADNYPDAYVSRISAENVDQVDNQVMRILKYETNPVSGSWFQKACGIASHQYGDSTRCNSLRNDLLAYGYTSVDKLYDITSPQPITNAINDGRGVVNYLGHGEETRWGFNDPYVWPLFSVSDVQNLSNTNLLPFVFSVACQVGSFNYPSVCFAEAWLRGGTKDNPKGAIAFFGSSINQDIVEPTTAQAEAVDLLVSDAKITVGGLCFNGVCKMLEQHGSAGENEADTWHIFGDAATHVWTKTPSNFTSVTITSNASSVTVNTGVAGSTICASSSDNGASFWQRQDNVSSYTFNTSVRPLYITVTKHNYVPYMAVTGGTFASNQYWFGNLYVRGDITINSGVTLTVQPGAVITFAPNSDDRAGGASSTQCEIIANGTLKADYATFTSSTKGSWYGIRYLYSSSSAGWLRNCTIRNANLAVFIDRRSPQIKWCSIDDADNYGIYIKGSSAWPEVSDNYIEGDFACVAHYNSGNGNFYQNSFRNAQYGVYVSSGSPRYDYYNFGRNKFETSISQDKVRVNGGQPWLGMFQYFTIPNTNYKYITNYSTSTVMAAQNWWDAYPPSDTYFYGSVDRSNPLSSPPSNPPAGPTWSLPKGMSEQFLLAFNEASMLFWDGKYVEARERFKELTAKYLDSEYSSYSLNCYMLTTEQLEAIGSQAAYLNSIKQNKSAHVNTRFYALKWLLQSEMRGGTIERAKNLAAEVETGSLYDREISFDLAMGLFEYQGDKQGAEEVLANLLEKFKDDDTAEAVEIIKSLMIIESAVGKPITERPDETDEEFSVGVFPNPSNASVKIRYAVENSGPVLLTIYNLLGQRVLTLVNKQLEAGRHEALWDGKDLNGKLVSSGVYLCRLETMGRFKTVKLLMAK
ncbi:MAG: C25 family cysteine peptidase [candidate division KSB1 bacterium]|nr:C25 family cysteine peptidase [candidate division KSB1 bacterium]MDZ7304616.1 C25 family cysteine peptidase [candidate division KSB1 bacterium]MDZ7313749.1 C25 family cysteine peptidase [candidate division KSB1 bacterium]